MTHKFFSTIFFFFSLTLLSCAQTTNARWILDEAGAKAELKRALSDTAIYIFIKANTLFIKSKEAAFNIVEPILFSTYGKENIIREPPYTGYLIGHYWVDFRNMF